MLIGGIILILIALGVVFFERRQTSRANAAKVTETLSCGDIDMLARGVESEVGGGFHQRCEVIGQAEPGEGGAVKAPHSGVDVVWHRSLVTHRYWEMEERVVDGRRERNRVERSEEVSNITSSSPFAVRDATGTVAVSPDGADVDQPERVLDRFDPHVESSPLPSGLMGVLGSVLRSGGQSGTLGFHYQEWVIRPGARLYVHGEVSDTTGRVAFTKPSSGRYIISTRSEEEIVGAAERNANIARIVTGVAAVAGIALVIAGLLS